LDVQTSAVVNSLVPFVIFLLLWRYFTDNKGFPSFFFSIVCILPVLRLFLGFGISLLAFSDEHYLLGSILLVLGFVPEGLFLVIVGIVCYSGPFQATSPILDCLEEVGGVIFRRLFERTPRLRWADRRSHSFFDHDVPLYHVLWAIIDFGAVALIV
jgi:hypothetical protein